MARLLVIRDYLFRESDLIIIIFYFSAVPTATSAVVVTLIGTQNLNSGFGKLFSSKPGFEID